MWKRLRRLVGGDAKAEAESALAEAERDYQAALRVDADVDVLVSRIQQHGTTNHIGQRLNAGITANLAALAAQAKEA